MTPLLIGHASSLSLCLLIAFAALALFIMPTTTSPALTRPRVIVPANHVLRRFSGRGRKTMASLDFSSAKLRR